MRELNLPLFQNKHYRNNSHAQKIVELKDLKAEDAFKEQPQDSD